MNLKKQDMKMRTEWF